MTCKDVLILGVGNYLLGDEGVGVHVAQRLQLMDLPDNVEVVDGGTGGFELIDFLRQRSKVIIVDCLFAGEPAGSVVRALPEDLELRFTPAYSIHQNGLRELLRQVARVDDPPQIIIFGVVPGKIDETGIRLSKVVEQRIPDLIAEILREASMN